MAIVDQGCSSIQNLGPLVEDLPPAIRSLFARFFQVSHERGDGGASQHRITRVYNRLLEDVTSFDESRTRRGPPADALEPLYRRCQAGPDCYFCSEQSIRNVLSRPGSGRLGRCFYFPPQAAFCRHHRLIFTDGHNPLDFSAEVISNLFACGERWALDSLRPCDSRGEHHPPVFYFVSWNVLCGSVDHAHCQVTLTSRFAEGGVERLARVHREYDTHYQRNFFDDYVELHDALGLVVRCGDASAFPSLTPVKEREVWFVQNASTPAHLPFDLATLMSSVLRSLVASAEAPCPAFNIGVVFPPLRPVDGWRAFPIVARVVDRGWPTLGVTDWATMEMYGSRIVASDPFALAADLLAS